MYEMCTNFWRDWEIWAFERALAGDSHRVYFSICKLRDVKMGREREMGKTFFWDTFLVELEVG